MSQFFLDFIFILTDNFLKVYIFYTQIHESLGPVERNKIARSDYYFVVSLNTFLNSWRPKNGFICSKKQLCKISPAADFLVDMSLLYFLYKKSHAGWDATFEKLE